MAIIVADSSSLILLAKCSLLEILAGLQTVLVPMAVYGEVVNDDTLRRFADAKLLARLASEDRVRVVKVGQPGQRMPVSLGKGEAEALLLAKQTTDAILATDDGKAIKACRYIGVPFIISPRIATELYRLDAIDLAKARSSIEKMKIVGRYAPDIVSDALLELEVLRNAKADDRQGPR